MDDMVLRLKKDGIIELHIFKISMERIIKHPSQSCKERMETPFTMLEKWKREVFPPLSALPPKAALIKGTLLSQAVYPILPKKSRGSIPLADEEARKAPDPGHPNTLVTKGLFKSDQEVQLYA